MDCWYCKKPMDEVSAQSDVVKLASSFSGVTYSCTNCGLLQEGFICPLHAGAILWFPWAGPACVECVWIQTATLFEDDDFKRLYNPEHSSLEYEHRVWLELPDIRDDERQLVKANLKLECHHTPIYLFCTLAAVYMVARSIQTVGHLFRVISLNDSLQGIFPEKLFKNPFAPG